MEALLLPEKPEEYFNAIDWWMERNRDKLLGGLQRVAVTHLVVHASSARSERNFSWAGIVATARRNRLSPTALGWLVFMKRNSRFLLTNEEVAAEYLRRYRKKPAPQGKCRLSAGGTCRDPAAALT